MATQLQVHEAQAAQIYQLVVRNHPVYNEPLRPTQIGRGLQELGIGWIATHSPQATGRVERDEEWCDPLGLQSRAGGGFGHGAIVAITTQGGAVRDTTSVQETLPAAGLAVAAPDRHADRQRPVRSLRTRHAKS